jgi:hypothetical protein
MLYLKSIDASFRGNGSLLDNNLIGLLSIMQGQVWTH